ncbi:helix-turn-helix domain-containing protein [Sphingomonas sp. QA11]|uniref:helix-turn-helix domain-containing protein n=1 Tax=Sphingomonas sp. QA11 TaxID=2950605 RepID=UPI002349850B|nr:helix-turn-helix transcriptional regulator [Sphingomonas sp. QA11]WCM26271.1 helix-turn-helix domain-containing protein [Sphingomonas sp. QA11]
MPNEDSKQQPIANVLVMLGERIEKYRLSRNLRQQDVAEAAGVRRGTVSKLEKGGGTIETLARVLRALDIGDRLLDIVPDARLSPMDAHTTRGTERARARPQDPDQDDGPWSWGEE